MPQRDLRNYNTSVWTRAQARKIQLDNPTTTQPLVDYFFPQMSNKDVWIWDTMPLRDLNNKICSINGWNVMFTLTSIKDYTLLNSDGNYDPVADFNNRHGKAFMALWFCRDAKSWVYGGRVTKDGVNGGTDKREWAGTPILVDDKGNVDLYYTVPTGNTVTIKNENAFIKKSKGKLYTNDNGVFVDTYFTSSNTLITADGKYYQTKEQRSDTNFRDPAPFINPQDGRLYMLFEGQIALPESEHYITSKEIGYAPPNFSYVDGDRSKSACIGIAVAKDLSGDEWELLPPLISSLGVQDQMERPHLVFKDGKVYVFTISHVWSGGSGLNFSDGVYGFVSDNLFGEYKPLNGSGIVLGNPLSNKFQTYSHYVMQDSWVVTSFLASAKKSGSPNRVGGVEARSVRLVLDGNETYMTEELDYGYMPATKDVSLK